MSPDSLPATIVPLSFDLGSLVRRSVASLYSHLITRPTGQALRLGIESQIGELGEFCVSVLDFSQVAVLDYSCADEAVAKLILRYQQPDRPVEAYFLVRGLDVHHLEMIEAVLERHRLALVAEVLGTGPTLLGGVTPFEREVWQELGVLGSGCAGDLAARLGVPVDDVVASLETLAQHRVVIHRAGSPTYHALQGLL